MIAEALQAIINLIAIVVNGIISMLPDTPFQFQTVNWPEWTKAVGWIVPFDKIIQHTVAFLACVATWYILRWTLRIVRAIQ